MGCEAVLLDEEHGKAAAGGVACDAGAVDSTADDEQVVGQVVYPAVAMTERQLKELLQAAIEAAQAAAPVIRGYFGSLRLGLDRDLGFSARP